MGYSLGLYENGDIDKPCRFKGDGRFLLGSNVPCEVGVHGELVPVPNRTAETTITYNYSKYFYEAAEGDERFVYEETDSDGNFKKCYGLRGLYGKCAVDTIPALCDMSRRILDKYRNDDGTWKDGIRKKAHYFDRDGHEIEDIINYIVFQKKKDVVKTEETYTVSEGDTSDYWEMTAANAIVSISSLLEMALACPFGIWMGD